MKKISTDKTFFWKYFWPYFGLIIILTYGIFHFLRENFFELIFFLYAIIWIIITKFFFALRHLSDVYIDHERKVFVIKNAKLEFNLPFSELVKIKTFYGKRIVKLIFSEKRIYFIPTGALDYFTERKNQIITELKGIIISNNIALAKLILCVIISCFQRVLFH
jgi:hypothetical protein